MRGEKHAALHLPVCMMCVTLFSGYQQAPSPDQQVQTPSPVSESGRIRAQLKLKLGVERFKDVDDPFGLKGLVTVEDLFNARVHFGHKRGMWNKRIKPYLYGTRNDIHIFNLDTTLVNLLRALAVVGHVAYQRGVILFVNERRQFEALTMQTALQCKEYYVTNWMPGTLTNSFKLLHTMRAPDLIIFTSVPRSKSAVKEANTHGIPSVGVVDSDCNPNFLLYPIPGNDDTPQAIKLYSDLFSEVILRAKDLRERDERQVLEEMEREAEKKKALEIEQALELEEELNSIYGKS